MWPLIYAGIKVNHVSKRGPWRTPLITSCLLTRTGEFHYSDIIMSAMASHITCVSGICLAVYSGWSKKAQLRVTSGFPSTRASNAGKVSIWWRHHIIHMQHNSKRYKEPERTGLFHGWDEQDTPFLTTLTRGDEYKKCNQGIKLCIAIALWVNIRYSADTSDDYFL